MALSFGRRPFRLAATAVAILAVALALRFYEIDRRSYWFDEGVTLGVARLSWSQFARRVWPNVWFNTQYLYYVLIRLWHVFGESEFAIRAFSALFSTGSVALTGLIGTRLFGRAAGFSAAAALAVHAGSIRYAQEARAYGLAVFLTTLSALLLARYLEAGRRRDLVGWAIVGGLAPYAQFLTAFAIAAQVLALPALGWAELKARRGLLAGLAGMGVLSFPMVYSALTTPPNAVVSWVEPLSEWQVLRVGSFLAGGRVELFLFALCLFGALAGRALRDSRPLARWGGALVVLWGLFPFACLVLLSVRNPILVERYLSMSIPAWTLLTGAMFGPLISKRRLAPTGWATLVFVLAAEARSLAPGYSDSYEDWRAPASLVSARTAPGDGIVYNSAWGGLTLGYYLDRLPRRPEDLQRKSLLFPSPFDWAGLARRPRVWLVLSRESRSFEQDFIGRLGPGHSLVNEWKFNSARVLLFDSHPAR